MTRFLAVLIGLGCASPAWAVGVGSSFGIGGGGWFGNPFDFGFGLGAQGFGPSLDLVFDPVVLQIHALELVDAAADGDLFVGANVYVSVHEAPVGGPFLGVVQPGASIDFWGDPGVLAIAGECRLGAQAVEGAGFGVYVVPSLGIAVGDGDADLFGGGALQFSAWFGG